MKNIKETVKQHGQYIVKYEDNSVFVAEKISAGVAWPTADKNGYFCVIADDNSKPIVPGVEQKPVEILVEEEHSLLPELFDGLSAQVHKCSCTVIYSQFNPAVVNKPGFDGTNKAFVTAFNNYKKKRSTLALLSLQPALITDWLMGILTVQKWQEEKALNVSRKTIMYQQLKSMTPADRKSTEQDRFPAMTALTCAMTPFVQAVVAQGVGLRTVTTAKYAW